MVYTKIRQLYFEDSKADKKDQSIKNQDCKVCRYVSGGGLTMLGVYVMKKFYDDIQIDKNKVKFCIKNNKSNNIYGFILGTFLISLGIARLANFQLHD